MKPKIFPELHTKDFDLFLAIISPILTVSKNVLLCLIGLILKIFRVQADYMVTALLENV